MVSIKLAVGIGFRFATSNILNGNPVRFHISQPMLLARYFSKKNITPHINFFTNETQFKVSSKGSKQLSDYSNEEKQRPLSILFCWLMAKPNAVQKHVQFYLHRDFDVLTVKITPWQVLWPATYTPVVEKELLPVLQSSNHKKILVHGFSIGGYVFSQLLKHFQLEPTKYSKLAESIQGQIWDSVTDTNGLSVGVSKSFSKNNILRKVIQKYAEFHLKIFYHVATKYYEEAHENFYYKPLKVPALFLSSKIDPISTMDVVQELERSYSSRGIKVEKKIWEDTNHVEHMYKYPEEYRAVVTKFVSQIDWSLTVSTSEADTASSVVGPCENHEDKNSTGRPIVGSTFA